MGKTLPQTQSGRCGSRSEPSEDSPDDAPAAAIQGNNNNGADKPEEFNEMILYAAHLPMECRVDPMLMESLHKVPLKETAPTEEVTQLNIEQEMTRGAEEHQGLPISQLKNEDPMIQEALQMADRDSQRPTSR